MNCDGTSNERLSRAISEAMVKAKWITMVVGIYTSDKVNRFWCSTPFHDPDVAHMEYRFLVTSRGVENGAIDVPGGIYDKRREKRTMYGYLPLCTAYWTFIPPIQKKDGKPMRTRHEGLSRAITDAKLQATKGIPMVVGIYTSAKAERFWCSTPLHDPRVAHMEYCFLVTSHGVEYAAIGEPEWVAYKGHVAIANGDPPMMKRKRFIPRIPRKDGKPMRISNDLLSRTITDAIIQATAKGIIMVVGIYTSAKAERFWCSTPLHDPKVAHMEYCFLVTSRGVEYDAIGVPGGVVYKGRETRGNNDLLVMEYWKFIPPIQNPGPNWVTAGNANASPIVA